MGEVRPAAFVAVAGAIFGLIHFYLWWRLVRDTTRRRRWRRAGALTVLVLALLVPMSFFGSREVHGLAWPGYLWLALMFYLFVLLVLIELPMLAARWALRRRAADSPDPGRRLLLARSGAIFAGVGAAVVTGSGAYTALGPPTIKRVEVRLAKLDRRVDGYRVALLADVHLGPMRGREQTERIVDMINDLAPDLIAIVGDLVDTGGPSGLRRASAPLRDLRSRHGSFFVTGNHEYYAGYQEWVEEVARLGIRPLRNERVEIVAGAGAFDLAGVNDPTGKGHGDGPDFGRALDGRDTTRPVVLLAHQPVQVHEAVRRGVDLQLSGHTHGGQMYPYHLLVRLEQPVLSGLSRFDGTQLYVTNGTGFWGPPVRVGATPDITLLELRAL